MMLLETYVGKVIFSFGTLCFLKATVNFSVKSDLYPGKSAMILTENPCAFLPSLNLKQFCRKPGVTMNSNSCFLACFRQKSEYRKSQMKNAGPKIWKEMNMETVG